MKIINYKLKIISCCILSLIIGSFLIMIFNQARQIEVDAATFDAPLLPGTDNQYNLGYIGIPNQRWQNGFFSGNLTTNGNVSIGTTTISEKLTVVNGNISQELDNSDSTGVSLIGTYSYGPNECSFGWSDYSPTRIRVSGKYAYVIEAHWAARCLAIFDVSNPSLPQRVGYVNLGSWPSEVYIAGRFAYIVGQYTSFIVDISNPKNPTILSSGKLGTGDWSYRIYVSGPYAYTTGEGPGWSKFYINNISNPLKPMIIGSSTLPFGVLDIYGSGRYIYIINNNKNLITIDISNSNNPQIINTYSLSDFPMSIYVSGRYAYLLMKGTVGSFPKINIIDISNPSNPQQINSLTLDTYYSSTFANIYISGKYAYAAIGDYNQIMNKFFIIDISNPNSIKKVANYKLAKPPTSLDISGHYAYITSFNDQIYILDISGLEAVSANIHSLEAGNLQVRNDIIAQGQLQISGGINVGTGGIFSAGPIGISIASTTQTDAVSAYFQGRVGIATTTPTQKLEVNGGIRLNPDSSEPDSTKPATCDISIRGLLWFMPGISGIADTLEICNSSSTDDYVWKKLY